MKLFGYLVLVLIVGGLTGCGKDKGKKDLEQAVDQPKLMQVWEGECYPNPLLGFSQRIYFKFDGKDYTEAHRFFEDTSCTKAAVDLKYKGEFTLGDEIAGGVRKMDVRFDDVDMVALSDAGRSTLERLQFCRVAAWQVGNNQRLNGHRGGLSCPLRKVPSGEYNSFVIEGEQLFLGKAGLSTGATTEADRPQGPDRKQPFHKTDRKID